MHHHHTPVWKIAAELYWTFQQFCTVIEIQEEIQAVLECIRLLLNIYELVWFHDWSVLRVQETMKHSNILNFRRNPISSKQINK